MPSLEEREGKISEEMAAILLGDERSRCRPPAQADHSKERNALAERLRVLKEKMDATPNRDPIYKDDLPHR